MRRSRCTSGPQRNRLARTSAHRFQKGSQSPRNTRGRLHSYYLGRRCLPPHSPCDPLRWRRTHSWTLVHRRAARRRALEAKPDRNRASKTKNREWGCRQRLPGRRRLPPRRNPRRNRSGVCRPRPGRSEGQDIPRRRYIQSRERGGAPPRLCTGFVR